MLHAAIVTVRNKNLGVPNRFSPEHVCLLGTLYIYTIIDFKISPCSVCCMFSSG